MTQKPDWHTEHGFTFALLPATTGNPENLIVILHGHCSNARRWENRAHELQAAIPHADIIILQAPIPVKSKGEEIFTWLPHKAPVHRKAAVWLAHIFTRVAAIENIQDFLLAQLAKRDLKEENLGLIGSSMGGIMALQAAFRHEKPVAAVVMHASAVLPFSKVRSRPPVCFIMGSDDEIFNKKKRLRAVFRTAAGPLTLQHGASVRRLRRKGVEFMEKLYPGLGHQVTDESWREGNKFLINKLKRKP